MDNEIKNEIKNEKEFKQSSANNRAKKKERREAKAARKAANKVEEKKTRPNNIVLGVMIFGVLVVMFAAVVGYNYFSKDATIEKFIEKNKETYTDMYFDQNTTATISAEGNSMKLVLDVTAEDDVADELNSYYSGEDGEKNIKYLASYFLGLIKPNTRGFSADVTATINLNGDELISQSMTYKETKKFLKDMEKEASELADEADEEDTAEPDAEPEAEEEAEAEDGDAQE